MDKQLSTPTRIKLDRLLDNAGDMALKRRARRIIEAINPQTNEQIMDLGCGTGYYLFLLSSLPVKLQLTGLDNDKKALVEGKESLKGRGIKFVLNDSRKLPFPKSSFDKIVASEVLEHVENDEQVLKEIYRVLKPGGRLVISVPSINYPFFWDPINWTLQHLFNTHIKTGFFSGLWYGHLRLYQKENLRKKFIKAGFKVANCEELTFWCLPFNHYLINLVARLLYDVKISPKIADSLSKFKETKKPLFIRLAFGLINTVDSLNELFPQGSGVNVFVVGDK